MSHDPNVLDRIDNLTPTDLWSDIEQRRAGPEPEAPVSPSRRVTVIAVAFLIAAAAIVVPIVVVTQTPGPVPLDTAANQRGVVSNPMGIPMTLSYPPDWHAHNVLQPAGYPNVDAGRQVGLVISNAQEAMPTLSFDLGGADGAGPLPDDTNLPPTFVTVTILTDEGRPVSFEDSSLPLSMDDATVAPGAANIRFLDGQIGGVPLTIEVQGGPQASATDLAAADAIVASIRSEDALDQPSLVPNVVGQNFLTALTSTEGFRLRDVEYRETTKAENGTILQQDPPAGSSAVQADGVIRVVVAARPRGPLLGTEWILDYLDGRSTAGPGPAVTLQFRPLRLIGFGGCNGYSARYEMDGRKVVVRGLTSTLIGCSGERGQIEASLFEILRASPVARFDATELRLTALPEGVATFTPQS